MEDYSLYSVKNIDYINTQLGLYLVWVDIYIKELKIVCWKKKGPLAQIVKLFLLGNVPAGTRAPANYARRPKKSARVQFSINLDSFVCYREIILHKGDETKERRSSFFVRRSLALRAFARYTCALVWR